MQDLERVGVKGEHGVGVLDHRPMAAVDSIEGADRDATGPRLSVGEAGHLNLHRILASGSKTASSSGLNSSPARAIAKGPIVVRRRAEQ